MTRIVIAALAVLLIAACNGPEKTSATDEKDTPSVESPAEPTPLDETIGDVEYAVSIDAEVAPDSLAPNVVIEELTGARQKMDLLTVTVSPPYPKELWVSYQVKSGRAFEDTPVALRVKFFAESGGGSAGPKVRRDLTSFSCVIGANRAKDVAPHKVDVMAGIEGNPSTFLVNADREAVLMPKGTEEAVIDPASATASPEYMSGAIKFTPIRVNFKDWVASP